MLLGIFLIYFSDASFGFVYKHYDGEHFEIKREVGVEEERVFIESNKLQSDFPFVSCSFFMSLHRKGAHVRLFVNRN